MPHVSQSRRSTGRFLIHPWFCNLLCLDSIVEMFHHFNNLGISCQFSGWTHASDCLDLTVVRRWDQVTLLRHLSHTSDHQEIKWTDQLNFTFFLHCYSYLVFSLWWQSLRYVVIAKFLCSTIRSRRQVDKRFLLLAIINFQNIWIILDITIILTSSNGAWLLTWNNQN